MDSDSLLRLLDVSRGLVAERDLEAVLERVLSTAQELTGARYAALGILDDRRTGLERFLTRGISAESQAAIGDLPRGRGVLGALIQDPCPLRLDDVGAHPRSYGFPSGHPPMSNFLGVPIRIRGETWGNLYLTEKPAGPFTLADEKAVVVLADWAAVAIDNARLYEREASRRDELERVVLALETSTTIARALGAETDLERVLELIVKRGRALVDARAMLMLMHTGDSLLVRAEAGQIMGTALGRRITLDRLSGRVLAQAVPLRVDDVGDQLLFSAAELGVPDAQTAMIVPLVYRTRVVGVLVAFDRLVDGPTFRAEDEALVLSFAASAAIALATAQHVERERLRQSIESAEQERRRWARELHDVTLQNLGALRLSLSTAHGSGDIGRLDDAVGDAIDLLYSEITALRALITDLRPAELDDFGIVPALQALIARCDGLYDFAIKLDADPDYECGAASTRLTSEAETAIYRTVQEAIRNVGKHADATTVWVVIRELGGLIRVVIADDGHGFDPGGRSEGFGLIGMQERAALAGGRCEVESSSKGTNVRFELPAVRRDAPARPRRVAA